MNFAEYSPYDIERGLREIMANKPPYPKGCSGFDTFQAFFRLAEEKRVFLEPLENRIYAFALLEFFEWDHARYADIELDPTPMQSNFAKDFASEIMGGKSIEDAVEIAMESK
jgi:hypothetical protein